MHPGSKSTDSTPPNTPSPLWPPLLRRLRRDAPKPSASRTDVGTGSCCREHSAAREWRLTESRGAQGVDSAPPCAHVPAVGARRGTQGARMADARLVVWYNTRCPVCDAGINRQRKKLIAAVAAGTIE